MQPNVAVLAAAGEAAEMIERERERKNLHYIGELEQINSVFLILWMMVRSLMFSGRKDGGDGWPHMIM